MFEDREYQLLMVIPSVYLSSIKIFNFHSVHKLPEITCVLSQLNGTMISHEAQ